MAAKVIILASNFYDNRHVRYHGYIYGVKTKPGNMVHIYGIKNCDTVQKALKWLDKKNVAYTFHNYKDDGIDKETLELWLKHLPVDKLVNTNSTTFKSLTATEKGSITNKAKAIALMMKYTSIIKRPVWDFGNGVFFLGWNEIELTRLV